MGIFSFVKPGKKIFKTITSVKPNVPVTKGQKLKRDLKIATQKSKAAGAKLDNTLFRIKQQKKRLEKGRVYSGKELEQQKYFKDMNKGREKKMGGGMMGRRFGMKKGSKFPDLTGDGKVTFADILKVEALSTVRKKEKNNG